MILGLLTFVVIFIMAAFFIISKSFEHLFITIIENKDAKIKKLDGDLHLEYLKGPKIKYIEPRSLILQKSVQIDQGVFDNPDHKNYILNDISLSLGKELLEQKLINFDVQSIQSPSFIGKEYRIIAQIKVLDDKHN